MPSLEAGAICRCRLAGACGLSPGRSSVWVCGAHLIAVACPRGAGRGGGRGLWPVCSPPPPAPGRTACDPLTRSSLPVIHILSQGSKGLTQIWLTISLGRLTISLGRLNNVLPSKAEANTVTCVADSVCSACSHMPSGSFPCETGGWSRSGCPFFCLCCCFTMVGARFVLELSPFKA